VFVIISYVWYSTYGRILHCTLLHLSYIQKWILLHFEGLDDEINVETKDPEFKNWLWMNPNELSSKAIYFKKDVYQKINRIFVPLIKDFIN